MAHPAAIQSSVRSAGVRDREMMRIDIEKLEHCQLSRLPSLSFSTRLSNIIALVV